MIIYIYLSSSLDNSRLKSKKKINMTSSSIIFFYITHVLLVIVISLPFNQSHVDPNLGFTELPFNTSYYRIQKPYDLAVDQRYRFTHGVHKLWVYSTDNPLSKNSPTKPRTEIIISVSTSYYFISSSSLYFLSN